MNINSKALTNILEEIKKLKPSGEGYSFESLSAQLLQAMGFFDIQIRTGGSQRGRDIDAKYRQDDGVIEYWYFEAKRYDKAIPKKELSPKVDDVDENCPNADYFAVISNFYMGNDAKDALEKKQHEVLFDILDWTDAQPERKFSKILLSYPETVIKFFEGRVTPEILRDFRKQAEEFLKNNPTFFQSERKLIKTIGSACDKFYDGCCSIIKRHISTERDYDQRKYASRQKLHIEFQRFVEGNPEKKFFYLIGKERRGKTNSLCHLAQKYLLKGKYPVLITNGKTITQKGITTPVYQSIKRELANKGFSEDSFEEKILPKTMQCLSNRGKYFLIFIDAINEATDYRNICDAFQETEFLQLLDNPVKICVSCRDVSWREIFQDEIYDEEKSTKFELDRFTSEELREAIKLRDLETGLIPERVRNLIAIPGVLEVYEKLPKEKRIRLSNAPNLTLADIFYTYLDTKIALTMKRGLKKTKAGILDAISQIGGLIRENPAQPIYSERLKVISDFDPTSIAENSWNLLLQEEGVLIQTENGYSIPEYMRPLMIAFNMTQIIRSPQIHNQKKLDAIDDFFDEVAKFREFEDVILYLFYLASIYDDLEKEIFDTLTYNALSTRNLDTKRLFHELGEITIESLFRVFQKDTENTILHRAREALGEIGTDKVCEMAFDIYQRARGEAQFELLALLRKLRNQKFVPQYYQVLNALNPNNTDESRHRRELFQVLISFGSRTKKFTEQGIKNDNLEDLSLAIRLLSYVGDKTSIGLVKSVPEDSEQLLQAKIESLGMINDKESEVWLLGLLNSEPTAKTRSCVLYSLARLKSSRLLEYISDSLRENTDWQEQRELFKALDLHNSQKAFEILFHSFILNNLGWLFYRTGLKEQVNRYLTPKQLRLFLAKLKGILKGPLNFNLLSGSFDFIEFIYAPYLLQELERLEDEELVELLIALICNSPTMDSPSQTESSILIKGAIKLLSKISTKGTVQALNEIISRKQRYIFQNALEQLKNFADDSSIPLLLDFLGTTAEKHMPYFIILVLARIEDPKAGRAIFDYACEHPSNIPEDITTRLEKYHSPEFERELLSYLKNVTEGQKAASALFLGNFRCRDAVDDLISIAKDESIQTITRVHSIFALGQIGDNKAYEILANLLPKEKFSFAAINALIWLDDERTNNLFIEHLRHGTSESVTDSMIGYLGRNRVAQSKDVLLDIVKDKRYEISPVTYEIAIRALGKVKAEDALNPLLDTIEHFNPHLQSSDNLSAIWALAKIGHSDKAWDGIKILLDNPLVFNRADITKLIGELHIEAGIDKLFDLLFDDDHEVQSAARLSLAQFEDLEQVNRRFREWSRSEKSEERHACALGLGAFSRSESKEVLIQLSEDRNAIVRKAAQQSLYLHHKRHAVDTLLTMLTECRLQPWTCCDGIVSAGDDTTISKLSLLYEKLNYKEAQDVIDYIKKPLKKELEKRKRTGKANI